MRETNPNTHLEALREFILNYTKDIKVKIYLFGSRATGKAHKLSDVDLALLPLQPLPAHFISQLKEKIEESTLPYSVDLIDLTEVDPPFRQKILAEAIVWKD